MTPQQKPPQKFETKLNTRGFGLCSELASSQTEIACITVIEEQQFASFSHKKADFVAFHHSLSSLDSSLLSLKLGLERLYSLFLELIEACKL